ncbi:STAS domain-containing protein [Amycolatopsis sp. NBC_00348]|uniref:STAS domain-containing protein n=1 Tax=unclassified Amycolatopsis TaxID=2618356 RepID=UPI002E0E407A|nr:MULTISPECIES: STAS domain-containing protein [unclassified Amycolatopsis]WSJ80609.1 STAS domain-containing protein [Amycolatopsis sp. NBC_01307]
MTETPAPDPTGLMLTVVRSGRAPGVLRVTVTGEVDMSTRPMLEAELERAVAEGPYRLVADLTGVGFCGVTGMATFSRLRTRCADAGIELVVRPSSVVRRALDLAALSSLFRLEGPWANGDREIAQAAER